MNTKAKGNLSEGIACDFLVSRGFRIVERNYLQKWGELDIVARRGMELHFIEVKSDFRVRRRGGDGYRPEEQVHDLKQRRLRRTIATYLVERKHGLQRPFVFDVAIVSRIGKGIGFSVELHENIVI